MIITLRGADFSASNIGTLSTWRITRSIGAGATYEGATSVDKDAAFTATVTIAEGYELGAAGVTVTMGGTVISAATVNGNVITINITAVTGNVMIKVPTVNISTGEEDKPELPGDPAVNYLLNLDFTQKSFANYISDGTLGAVTGNLSSTHSNNGDTFISSDVAYVALGKSLTFPTNFEIHLRLKTSEYNHTPGCGIPLFTTNAGRPWIFLRGDYEANGQANNYDNAFGLQSRLLSAAGDVITIDDVTIPCNDNTFHDVIIHYEGNNVWMNVDGVKSKTVTTDRTANTVTHMFGYSATYTVDKVTVAYIRVVEL